VAAKTPRAYPIKLFTVRIYEVSKNARVFVPDKAFQPNIMFVGKAGAYPRVRPET